MAFKFWLYDTLCRVLLVPAVLTAQGADDVAHDLSFAAAHPTPA